MEANYSILFSSIDEALANGSRKQLIPALRELLGQRYEYAKQAIANAEQARFAEAISKALFLELDDEEEESIELAELAYTVLSAQAMTLAALKARVILVHYFYDYLTDDVITLFLEKYRESELLQARSLAIESLEKMQIADLYLLEQMDEQFVNNDLQLIEVSNELVMMEEVTDEHIQEGMVMHKVLTAYLKVKYKQLLGL